MEVSGQKTNLAQRGKGTSHQMPDSDGRAGTTRLEPAATTAAGADGRSAQRPSRGRLRIYLGSAAGVGKTYAMLSEGHRRVERGADVVVAFAETHARPQTAALIDGLEVIPRRRIAYRDSE